MKKKAMSLGSVIKRTELKSKELQRLTGGMKGCNRPAASYCCISGSTSWACYGTGVGTPTIPDCVAQCNPSNGQAEGNPVCSASCV